MHLSVIMFMPGTRRGQKVALAPLELTVVSSHVGSANQTPVLCHSSIHSLLLS